MERVSIFGVVRELDVLLHDLFVGQAGFFLAGAGSGNIGKMTQRGLDLAHRGTIRPHCFKRNDRARRSVPPDFVEKRTICTALGKRQRTRTAVQQQHHEDLQNRHRAPQLFVYDNYDWQNLFYSLQLKKL